MAQRRLSNDAPHFRELILAIVLPLSLVVVAVSDWPSLLKIEASGLSLVGLMVLLLSRGDWNLTGPHFFVDLVGLRVVAGARQSALAMVLRSWPGCRSFTTRSSGNRDISWTHS